MIAGPPPKRSATRLARKDPNEAPTLPIERTKPYVTGTSLRSRTTCRNTPGKIRIVISAHLRICESIKKLPPSSVTGTTPRVKHLLLHHRARENPVRNLHQRLSTPRVSFLHLRKLFCGKLTWQWREDDLVEDGQISRVLSNDQRLGNRLGFGNGSPIVGRKNPKGVE